MYSYLLHFICFDYILIAKDKSTFYTFRKSRRVAYAVTFLDFQNYAEVAVN